MNNNILLSLALNLLPVLSIIFVGIILIHKIYFKIRSLYPAKVNCWFCNFDTKVDFVERNSWTCPQCDQYNGFTKDGDYNREIYEQLDCSGSTRNKENLHDNSSSNKSFSQKSNPWWQSNIPVLPLSNGFCDACNEAQRLKIEKLAQFEPKNESRFDEELKAFKEKLEDHYKLCETCSRHLTKVLREKKRMIIGSKFLEYVLKGAKRFKEPYLIKIRQHIHEIRKQRLNRIAIILTLINFICLIKQTPIMKREQAINLFGQTMGTNLYIVLSHIYALGRVIISYVEILMEYEIVEKSTLFIKTIAMMVMYSLGLRLPLYAENTLSSLFLEAYPFVLLTLAFIYKVLDSLKVTRFTYILISWSIFAGGLLNNFKYIEPRTLMFLNTLVTFMLTITTKYKSSPKIHDNSANNFHKIYSEDYLSDEDTISMLSEKINSSNASVQSSCTLNHSFIGNSNFLQRKSPLTSSTYSLNALASKKHSPSSNYQGCFANEGRISHGSTRTNFDCDGSMYNFPKHLPRRNPLFGSNLDLHNTQRPVFDFQNNNLNQSSLTHSSQKNPLNDSFYTAVNSRSQNPFQSSFCVKPGLHSPFSVSSNAVYQVDRDRATNLLTPSRFSSNCLANNGTNINAWLNGEDPIHSHTSHYNNKSKNVFTMKDLEENLSRTSSHSSGFESQSGPQFNISRENSCLPDTNDILQRTSNLEPSMSFRPVSSQTDPPFLTQDSFNHHRATPLPSSSLNYANSSASLYQRRNGSSSFRDCFNLNKINEELPTLRKGDLLRKWQESQKTS